MIGFEGTPNKGVKILTKSSLIIPDNWPYLEFLNREAAVCLASRRVRSIISVGLIITGRPGGALPYSRPARDFAAMGDECLPGQH